MREAGATAAQEVAFTLANGLAYVRAAVDAGFAVDDLAPRLSFFFACHMHLFEEVAKFRAARRLWATLMRERFGATDPRSQTLRFHTQTGGATLTAQQPENNIVRTALQAMAAVLGGTQSLHTNSFDEALAFPTEQAANIALRTQQVLGYETGVAETVDPLGGSYYVEALTDELERARHRDHREGRRDGRRRRGDRGRLLPGRDPRSGVPDPAGDRDGRPGRRRREPVRRHRRQGRGAPADLRRGNGTADGPAPRAPRLAGTDRRWMRPSRRWRAPHAGRRTSSHRCGRRSGAAPPWARSPTCSAASSVSIDPPTSPGLEPGTRSGLLGFATWTSR